MGNEWRITLNNKGFYDDTVCKLRFNGAKTVRLVADCNPGDAVAIWR